MVLYFGSTLMIMEGQIFEEKGDGLATREIKAVLIIDALIEFGLRKSTECKKLVTVLRHSVSTMQYFL